MKLTNPEGQKWSFYEARDTFWVARMFGDYGRLVRPDGFAPVYGPVEELEQIAKIMNLHVSNPEAVDFSRKKHKMALVYGEYHCSECGEPINCEDEGVSLETVCAGCQNPGCMSCDLPLVAVGECREELFYKIVFAQGTNAGGYCCQHCDKPIDSKKVVSISYDTD